MLFATAFIWNIIIYIYMLLFSSYPSYIHGLLLQKAKDRYCLNCWDGILLLAGQLRFCSSQFNQRQGSCKACSVSVPVSSQFSRYEDCFAGRWGVCHSAVMADVSDYFATMLNNQGDRCYFFQRRILLWGFFHTSWYFFPSLVLNVGTWFPSFQGHPLISGAMPLESGAVFA